jgi:hypothetical protein
MTPPGIAAERFLIALLLGCPLGFWYGFLRPLGGRNSLIRDSLFILAAAAFWVVLGFGVCQGDLRIVYLFGLLAGSLIWDLTMGVILKPIFAGFWKYLDGLFDLFLWPMKKILHFLKILFASVKKWVTIKWNYRRHLRRRVGGKSHGCAKKTQAQDSACFSTQFHAAENRGDCPYRILYGGIDRP